MVRDWKKPILALNLQTISTSKQSNDSDHTQESFMANSQNPSYSIAYDINRWSFLALILLPKPISLPLN